MTSIATWLQRAASAFQAVGITTHRLDAEVILAAVLACDRSYLHAHGNDTLTAQQLQAANMRKEQRLRRVPIAYITGSKEFYGHDFAVSPHTLIPRPETETLVELILSLRLMPTTQIIDVGTGTGAIAISLKLARPDLAIRALDLSPKTLAVAKNNADRLHAGEIIFAQGDLLSNVTLSSPSCIVANLPYVDPQWERSPETAFEPPLALFAKDGGLALIYKLIGQSAVLQSTGDYLALEADPVQHSRIIQTATAAGYALHKAQEYALLFQKC